MIVASIGEGLEAHIAERETATLLLRGSQMAALNKPTHAEHTSVKRWMDMEQPLIGDDAGFIAEREDLVTLRPGREYAWLDAAVEKLIQNLHMPALEVSNLLLLKAVNDPSSLPSSPKY